MPRRGGRLNGRFNDEADSQPLFVSSREDLSTRTSSPASASADNVLFSVDDDDDNDDDNETSALAAQDDTLRRTKADQTVRFQEHVQVIAPSLRSTLESREAGASVLPRDLSALRFVRWHADQRDSPALLFFSFFSAYELDSDDLDDDVNLEHGIQRSDRHREQSMPLLVGLLDASAVRRSLDIPMDVDGVPAYPDIDLDELTAKQGRGGGMLNSIANMANSILGAGV